MSEPKVTLQVLPATPAIGTGGPGRGLQPEWKSGGSTADWNREMVCTGSGVSAGKDLKPYEGRVGDARTRYDARE